MSLAQETVDLLKDFLGELGALSKRMANQIETRGSTDQIGTLIDHLQLVHDSVGQIRMSLDIEGQALIGSQEAELAEILKDLVIAVETKDAGAQAQVLNHRLPAHLSSWNGVSIQNQR